MRTLAALQVSVLVAIAVGAGMNLAVWYRTTVPPLERLEDPPIEIPAVAFVAPVPAPPARRILRGEEPRCCSCRMEELRQRQRAHQVTIEARYLGYTDRRDELDEPTRARCTPAHKSWASVRFALVGANPWRGNRDVAAMTGRAGLQHMLMTLPCPELSRSAYRGMYGLAANDPDEDGLGTAPVLRRGETYRLRVVESADLTVTGVDAEPLWTLVRVDR